MTSGVAPTCTSRNDLPPQLGDGFLSSKHQDYLAVVAEFHSVVRA